MVPEGQKACEWYAHPMFHVKWTVGCSVDSAEGLTFINLF